MGDNLGINEIMGMTTSFKGTPFCRICRAQAHEWQKMTTEDVTLLRNSENYLQDLCQNDFSKTGIKEICVFNQIIGYDFSENQALDMMHDVWEGGAKYVMRSIIYDFIFRENRCFTLQQLNQRIQAFNYGPYESYKPPVISLHSLKSKVILKFSAAEMACLVKYFGIIMGDLIDSQDPYWKLYLYLRKIVDVIVSPRITEK